MSDLWQVPGHADDIAAATGATLLEQLVEFVRRFVACSPTQADAVALWVIHTWAMPAAITTARLSIQSAEKQSGKTRLLEVLELLTPGPLSVANISPAALFRVIADRTVTILVDECDAIFSPKSNTEDLRALLNAGYRRGATVARVVGDGKAMKVKTFPVFAPVALAGIGTLPDTIQDRSIVIRLRRRAPDEVVARLRRRLVEPEARTLTDGIVAWVAVHVDDLTAAVPELPDKLGDRQADVWEPLLAIADAVGDGWPARARECALAMCQTQTDDDGSLGVRLLADCRTVFGAADRLSSADLSARLAAIEDAPWGDWYGKPVDARWLAKRLKPFDVKPSDHRFGDKTLKGYLVAGFADAWTRYLPPPTRATSETRATPQANGCNDVADVADVAVPEADLEDAFTRYLPIPDEGDDTGEEGVPPAAPERCVVCGKPCRRVDANGRPMHSVCERQQVNR